MEAKIVIGLSMGDEGKGRTVDYLCLSAEKPIVVRFSGGQQVGHTVMIDGKKHVHSNFIGHLTSYLINCSLIFIYLVLKLIPIKMILF